MAQKDIGNKTPLHDLKNTDEVMEYYDEWAKSQKYNKDMDAWEYSGPKETAEVINRHQKNKKGDFFLFRVGDAISSRNIHAAIYDSLRICKDF